MDHDLEIRIAVADWRSRLTSMRLLFILLLSLLFLAGCGTSSACGPGTIAMNKKRMKTDGSFEDVPTCVPVYNGDVGSDPLKN